MAPELRKRKPLPEVQKLNNAGKSAKPSPKGKRKAPEDASPVSLKKQRPVKKVAAEPKPAKKPVQKAKKAKPVEEEVEEKVEEEDATIEVPDASSGDEEEGKKAQALAIELDSGDEDMTEGDNAFEAGQDVGKIPKVSKQIQQAAKGSDGETGVLYIGRVPHGFYEHEMRQYFEQFGTINKLRLSRNKKTGASKHFAFVEFAEASTAEIVAKTMNNYLLFGHILKCRIIPKDQVHEDLFKGANRRFKAVPWNKMAGNKLQKPLTESAWATKVSNEQAKRTKRATKLKAIGYEFEAPEMKDVPAPAPIPEKVAEVETIEDAPAEKEEEVKEDEVKKIEVTVEAVEEAKPEAEEPEVEVEVEVTTKAAPKAKVTRAKPARGKGRKAKA
ncbi:nucleolar protein [Neonectria magnoliae]|uniref:Nucleolar protein n=1 Tax=Neonectria magnoliae TaxID=2732573 RepID=A0ABR1HEB4_9HYPO